MRGIQEFGKLAVDDAREMAKAVGKEMEIIKPMTVAEICNLGINKDKIKAKKVGFG